MFRIIPFLLAALFAIPSYAQLEAPKEVEQNSPIVVTCTVPASATTDVQITWRPSSDAVKFECPDGHKAFVWAPPGDHSMEATVATQTFTKMMVLVPDPMNPTDLTKAKPTEVKISAGFSINRYVAPFTVKGEKKPEVSPAPPVTVTPAPVTNVTSATYVYEKDQTAVPPAVMSGLNRLNREKKIVATLLDKDVTDGDAQVPDQYKIPFAEANKAGLPSLVVMAGSTIVKVVKDPRTEQQVVEAVP